MESLFVGVASNFILHPFLLRSAFESHRALSKYVEGGFAIRIKEI